MNMNHNYPTTIFRRIFDQNFQISGKKYIFTIFAHELFKVKMKIVNNTRNTYTLGQNTTKYRSQIIVVHVYATVSSKVHNIVNGIKPGSDAKKTDKHVVDCSKAVCRGVK